MAALPTFVVTLVQEEFHLKLRSTCQVCGESKVLSAADGSLQDWQEAHRCARPEPRGVSSETPKIPGAA